jgi:transposase-like protein
MYTKAKICPLCSGKNIVKRGLNKFKKQIFWCKDCTHRFTNSKQKKKMKVKNLWIDFVFHKQTIRELAPVYELDRKTIYSYLLSYEVKEKKHKPREVHILADALYFGTREEKTTWCVVVFRDHDTKENIWWDFGDTETESLYRKGRLRLEELGYVILSITGDGFGGLRGAFSGIPYQMCLVHMERLVVKGTTRRPKLEAGIVLLALTKSLFKTKEETFKKRLNLYIETYRDFLNEKAVNEFTGESWWVHDELRKAVFSLTRFAPFLFTYEKDKNIPSTTNSLEGHFGHLRDVVNIHRGTARELKEKIIHTILLASTIAPDDEEIQNII